MKIKHTKVAEELLNDPIARKKLLEYALRTLEANPDEVIIIKGENSSFEVSSSTHPEVSRLSDSSG